MAVLKFSEFQAITRNDPLDVAFSSIIEDTMNLVSKVMLPLFFTPVVAITHLFSRNGWLILVNCTIALGNIASTIFGCIEGTTTFADLSISLIVMGSCIFAAISATPNFFPLIYNFSNVFFAFNVISIAINASFFLKDLAIFAVKQIAEFFNLQLTDLFVVPDLTCENNEAFLEFLMVKLFSHGLCDEKINDDQKKYEISLINKMIKVLGKYVNDYNFSFLGAVVNKRKIDNVKKLISAFYLGGNFNNVIQFIELELNNKMREIMNLDKARKKLEASRDSLGEYNNLLCKYFTEVKKLNSKEGINLSFNNCNRLFKSQIKAHLEKCYLFYDALPPSSKFKKNFEDLHEKMAKEYILKDLENKFQIIIDDIPEVYRPKKAR